MYAASMTVQNLRVFEKARVELCFPGRALEDGQTPLLLPNVNLILGNNGAGKSTLLKAIALASLGPVADKFSPYKLVRQVTPKAKLGAKPKRVSSSATDASIDAEFVMTWQDVGLKKPSTVTKPLAASVKVQRRGDEEFVRAGGRDQPEWEPIFTHNSPAFLTVGYGATRRVETDASASSPQQRLKQIPLRQQRVQSLFSEHFPLVPLNQWLPELQHSNKGRFTQVVNRLNEVLPDGYEFHAERDTAGDYLFRQGRALAPFPALSDGCRAFIGWVADLLYHICMGCPSGVKLVDNCGLVLVDEIDLHLHPEWQRVVIPKLAAAFPLLQYVFTSHSPIVVGTLERGNIWVCEADPKTGVSIAEQKDIGVHGLNSDQILLTDYFGLKSTRAPRKERQLDEIAAAAERGTPKKAREFLRALVESCEGSEQNTKAGT